jgi:hypothetical protein
MMMQDPIFTTQNPMRTRNNFAEIYQPFGHALSRKFASPVVGHSFSTVGPRQNVIVPEKMY